MGRAFLALADCIAIVAMVAILTRLFIDYQRGTLTAKDLLIGGFLFAGTLGLFAAGIQTLAQGPGL
jgi:hypothetical protein